ncbi:MAG: hydroxymethylbilane synthase, partial [Anaerolineales bacterium]|nr:hydroxymethylbilane synthase [Anaerolineales bacterium]
AVPVAAYAVYQDGRLALDAFVGSPDGQRRIRVQGTGENAWELGAHLAQTAVSQGAMEILTHV